MKIEQPILTFLVSRENLSFPGSMVAKQSKFSFSLQTEKGKSLSRSNYPSGFLVRRELLEGRKRSLFMHAPDFTPRKADSSFSPQKPSTSSLEVWN